MIPLKSILTKASQFIWRKRWIFLVAALGFAVGVSFLVFQLSSSLMLAAAAFAGGGLCAVASVVGSALLIKIRFKFQVLTGRIRALEDHVSIVNGQLNARAGLLEERINDARALLEIRTNQLRTEAGEYSKATDRRIEKFASRLDRVRQNVSSAGVQMKKIDAKLAVKADAGKFKDARQTLESLRHTVQDLEFKAAGYRVHNRELSKTSLKALARDWSEPLGLPHTDHTIGYLANKITTIEERCTGRLATATETMIARTLAAQSLSSQRLRVLEIGVLFGVASLCFHKLCAHLFEDIKLTLVDPFEGYYGPGVVDLITGVPVTRDALEENIASCNVDRADFEIIQGFSHDPEVVSQLSGREFDVLLIDGDHSYEGVKRDYELYAHMVRKGGIILFDDYGVNEWPEIKRFVDEAPAKDDNLEFLMKGFRTAVFRVRSGDGG